MNLPSYHDSEIEASFNWFLSFMSEIHWNKRKLQIEKTVQIDFKENTPSDAFLSDMSALSIKDDSIGWYLYLVDCLLNDITKYEPIQGARIAPIFKRFGMDLEILKNIEGIDIKIKKLLKSQKSQADSVLFEILTALNWAKNGWEVSFIPEGKSGKSPDLFAKKNKEQWFIECKRLSQNSDYSIAERNKWLKMLSYISSALIKYNLLLDIVFHVELETLNDDFLKEQLLDKFNLIETSVIKISNEIWDVSITHVDLKSIDNHLKKFYVKNASTQLRYLIGGKHADSIGFTSGIYAKYVAIGENGGNNLYIEKIEQAYGVNWKCDAPNSINSKSRDIKYQLKKAIEQLPNNQNSAIHIGLETLDGTDVEKVRFDKILKTVSSFDIVPKKIKRLYCHFFQSYSPVDQTWVIDETISWFSTEIPRNDYPLNEKFLIIPWDEKNENDNVHWLREQP